MTLEIHSINWSGISVSARVPYSFQEGNTHADCLTNLVFNFPGEHRFNNIQDLPIEGRRIVNLDKSSTPKIRGKVTYLYTTKHSYACNCL